MTKKANKTTLCPSCKIQKTKEDFKPFCSKRCADVDLGRWFSQSYAIPVRPQLDDE